MHSAPKVRLLDSLSPDAAWGPNPGHAGTLHAARSRRRWAGRAGARHEAGWCPCVGEAAAGSVAQADVVDQLGEALLRHGGGPDRDLEARDVLPRDEGQAEVPGGLCGAAAGDRGGEAERRPDGCTEETRVCPKCGPLNGWIGRLVWCVINIHAEGATEGETGSTDGRGALG